MAARIDDLAEGKMKPWHHVPKVRCLHIIWMVPTRAGVVPDRHATSLILRGRLAPFDLPSAPRGAPIDPNRGDDGA